MKQSGLSCATRYHCKKWATGSFPPKIGLKLWFYLSWRTYDPEASRPTSRANLHLTIYEINFHALQLWKRNYYCEMWQTEWDATAIGVMVRVRVYVWLWGNGWKVSKMMALDRYSMVGRNDWGIKGWILHASNTCDGITEMWTKDNKRIQWNSMIERSDLFGHQVSRERERKKEGERRRER